MDNSLRCCLFLRPHAPCLRRALPLRLPPLAPQQLPELLLLQPQHHSRHRLRHHHHRPHQRLSATAARPQFSLPLRPPAAPGGAGAAWTPAGAGSPPAARSLFGRPASGFDASASGPCFPLTAVARRGTAATVIQWRPERNEPDTRGPETPRVELPARRCLTRSAAVPPLPLPQEDEEAEAEAVLRMRKGSTKEDVEKRRESVMTGSAHVILYAIGSNLLVAAAKAAAAYTTGSSAILAEVFHSLADACNEAFILWGIRASKKPADLNHPYGFQRERYAWALVSGCGVFFLGCGVSMYHGITGLLEPHELSHPGVAFVCLGTSLCVEGFTMFKAMRQIQKSAAQANVSFMEYLRQGADPTAVHVFVEDVASVTGIAIASTALSVALITGNPLWDSAGSIGIGLLLGYVAKFLVKRNVRSIVETSMDQQRLAVAVSILKSDATVKTVSDVKSTSLGPEWARFKAEVHFNSAEVARRRMDTMTREQLQQALIEAQGLQTEQELKDFLTVHGEASIRQLAKELARIEARITAEVPEITHCDLEIY